MPALTVAAGSLDGPRPPNQDVYYAEYIEGGFIMAVADGMGGPEGGGLASATAASVFEELMEEEFEGVREWLDFVFGETNERIFNYVRVWPDHMGMGTTLTVAVLFGGSWHIGHVGDCRLYRLRAGMLEQLTTDHTVLDPQILRGGAGEAATRVSSGATRMLTRSVGTRQDVFPDYFRSDAVPGDRLLLCSDGLYTSLSDGDIRKALLESPPQGALGSLLGKVKARGVVDDATAVVVRVDDLDRRTVVDELGDIDESDDG